MKEPKKPRRLKNKLSQSYRDVLHDILFQGKEKTVASIAAANQILAKNNVLHPDSLESLIEWSTFEEILLKINAILDFLKPYGVTAKDIRVDLSSEDSGGCSCCSSSYARIDIDILYKETEEGYRRRLSMYNNQKQRYDHWIKKQKKT